MDIFKAAVRLVVIVFVLVGSLVTLAGANRGDTERPPTSADEQDNGPAYGTSKQEMVSADLGPAG